LEKEGIFIHHNDSEDEIPQEFTKVENTLIVYTPAIPQIHEGFNYFKNHGFKILKRAEVLGLIAEKFRTIAVAGTHGKTSVSSAIAHIINQSDKGCLAFLGGISKNYQTNLILPKIPEPSNQIAVIEADEFDRSFLTLNPYIAIITAMDADHLDIYENKENFVNSFNHFVKNIKQNGMLIYKKGLILNPEYLPEKNYTYSLKVEADFFARNLKINDQGIYNFDLVTPTGLIENLQSGVAGKLNAENAVAAASICYLAGLDADTIRKNLAYFIGVSRRFDFQINNKNIVFVDDYAHHPEELKAFISSVKEIFPGKKITGIFQPHLFSRTRDFAGEFAKSLDLLDELILLDIYPARELPIEGVSSEIIFDQVSIDEKKLCSMNELENLINQGNFEVLLTMGAGDIDKMVAPIKQILEKK
jgi:UDP-N-acetylmuramate--alanine ligase